MEFLNEYFGNKSGIPVLTKTHFSEIHRSGQGNPPVIIVKMVHKNLRNRILANLRNLGPHHANNTGKKLVLEKSYNPFKQREIDYLSKCHGYLMKTLGGKTDIKLNKGENPPTISIKDIKYTAGTLPEDIIKELGAFKGYTGVGKGKQRLTE